MFDLKRLSMTVLGFAALIWCAGAAPATATPATTQLVITSATFDESNGRLVIDGQNLSSPSHGREGHDEHGHSSPPIVTLDLQPLTVISATSTEIVASLSGTFPDGTYLITVSRGNGEGESGAFAVAIYHEDYGQGGQGPSGPAGPAGTQGPAGPQGAAGSVGAIGPAGPVGPQGPAGAAGAIGAVGAVGPAGAIGPAGPVGPQGPAGAAGAIGPEGPAGAIGPIGPQGPVGATGAIGPQGPAGPTGAIGPQGSVGAIGATGPEGPAGPAGPTGLPGSVGPVGPAGPQGVAGPIGPSGPQGVPGVQGVAGAQGVPGAQGPAGLQGVAGVSGYQIVTATNSAGLGAGKFINAKAVCPAGTRVLAGGVTQTPPLSFAISLTLSSSYPDTNQSWFVELRNNEGFSVGTITITVYAICAIAN